MFTARAASLLLLLPAFALACGDDDGGSDAGAMDGGAACATAAECDDGVYCNGLEQCAPDDPAAAA
ncbi:MAG TPA: hypothetical protein RMH26_18550, partial [Polyangiaceae bacterium LLY-WYZ-15_(1-7)]|nr:hypothetical protein [Polyangiaceae bacterium LLY-WYZ-15_(1-7)]